MANSKNWHPDGEEWWGVQSKWFDKVPKAVLFVIAREFAMRCADNFTPEAGLKLMQDEWKSLFEHDVVPQKPPK